MDFGNGPKNNNLIIANFGGSNDFFVRAGSGNKDRDMKCVRAIEKREFTHWAVVVRPDAEIAIFKNGEELDCAYGSV